MPAETISVEAEQAETLNVQQNVRQVLARKQNTDTDLRQERLIGTRSAPIELPTPRHRCLTNSFLSNRVEDTEARQYFHPGVFNKDTARSNDGRFIN